MDMNDSSQDDTTFAVETPWMQSTLQYQSLVRGGGYDAGSSHGPGHNWVDNLFAQSQIEHSQIHTQPEPTQETQETPQYDLRTNPMRHEQFTFPSDHMPPRHKRGRGR